VDFKVKQFVSFLTFAAARFGSRLVLIIFKQPALSLPKPNIGENDWKNQ
jgi:hypothetical protein